MYALTRFGAIKYIPCRHQRFINTAACVVIFSRLYQNYIASLQWVLDAIYGQHTRALNEDEYLVNIMDVPFWVRCFAGLEYVYAAASDFGITQ